MLRKPISYLALACLLLGMQAVHALGLGEIVVQSHIGQPLQAEIALATVSPGELDGLRFRIADRATYQAQGLAWITLLQDVRLRVESGPEGNTLVVSSHKPVPEPFLELLIVVEGLEVNLMRHYSILLDLPAASGR